MTTKKLFPFLIIALVISTFFSIKYVNLKNKYNEIANEEKLSISDYITSTEYLLKDFDLDKLNNGDKASLNNFIRANVYLEDAYALSRSTHYGDITIIDATILQKYNFFISDTLNQYFKNAHLDYSYKDKLALIVNDLKLIVDYVDNNTNFSQDNSSRELYPKLKFLST